jgi:hypothetical protein
MSVGTRGDVVGTRGAAAIVIAAMSESAAMNVRLNWCFILVAFCMPKSLKLMPAETITKGDVSLRCARLNLWSNGDFARRRIVVAVRDDIAIFVQKFEFDVCLPLVQPVNQIGSHLSMNFASPLSTE